MSRALRGQHIERLIRAVADAQDADETDFVEWKTDLDLSTPRGRVRVARTIIGMANRDPVVARRAFEGVGYILVGVEPGNLCGTAMLDPADLHDPIVGYVGKRIVWSSDRLSVDGRTVICFTVEAPRPGDRIECLRRQGPVGEDNRGRAINAKEGTVFVRRPGKTVPASPDELEALQDRVLDRLEVTPAISVAALTVADGLPWWDVRELEDHVEGLVRERRRSLLAEAEKADRKNNPENYAPQQIVDPLGRLNTSALLKAQGIDVRALRSLGSWSEIDERTLADYREAVTEWSEAMTGFLVETFPGRIIANDLALCSFEVFHRSERNLSKAELVVSFTTAGLVGLDEEPDLPREPRLPRPFGEGNTTWRMRQIGYLPRTLAPYGGIRPPLLPSRSHVKLLENGFDVVCDLGDLYPQKSYESDPVHLLLVAPGDGPLQGQWELRAQNLDGVVSGLLTVSARTYPLDPRQLITAKDLDAS